MHSVSFQIPAAHPALAGHFPGNPLVPGVVLLERVAAAVEEIWRMRVIVLRRVKFVRALKPGEIAQLQIERTDDGVRFRIDVDAMIAVSGLLEVTA